MSEWWTYTLSDFLLFSPHTYYRLFELYNAAIWPGQMLAMALGLAVVVLLGARRPWRGRAVSAILAACWLWVAWGFLFTRYATINWTAVYMAAAFAVEALLLVLVGVVGDRLGGRRQEHWTGRAGLGFVLFALLIQPLVGPLAGRAWSQVELFGVAPDPTVVATLGVLLTVERARWELLAIPLAWCAVSGATLWTMEAPDAWIMPAAAALALVLNRAPRSRCANRMPGSGTWE
ncbi:MAG TPA: DUF6064 family protein [Azospirillum sp.]|nr:DUF6064 family protein [Azospirillum sp.]